jgi:hypothetical protein
MSDDELFETMQGLEDESEDCHRLTCGRRNGRPGRTCRFTGSDVKFAGFTSYSKLPNPRI